ncbi:MAG: hypothetical protein ACRD2J_02065 [Thermoanaerobaculia bacterium]
MSRPEHPIFHTPLETNAQPSETPTPPDYSKYGFLEDVPPTLPTVAVLRKEWDPLNLPFGSRPDDSEPGLVTSDAGFLDSPDMEAITGGIHLKGPGYVAIGRQGHILQWGFYGSPEEMTDTGRKMFINAIHYISRFRDDPVLVLRETPPRQSLATTFGFLGEYEGERRSAVLARYFGDAVPADLPADSEGLRKWYLANEPFLAYEGPLYGGTYFIDEDARAIGIANRDPKLLEWSVEHLEGDAESERARRLLDRYTDVRLETVQEWRDWLEENRDSLFFTDWGGYEFLSTREQPPLPATAAVGLEPVRLDLIAYRRGDDVVAQLKVRIDPEFHVYAKTTKDPAMLPFGVRLPVGSPFAFVADPIVPEPRDGDIAGHFTVESRLRGEGDRVVLSVDYQACTPQFCLPPVTGKEIAAELPKPRPAAVASGG